MELRSSSFEIVPTMSYPLLQPMSSLVLEPMPFRMGLFPLVFVVSNLKFSPVPLDLPLQSVPVQPVLQNEHVPCRHCVWGEAHDADARQAHPPGHEEGPWPRHPLDVHGFPTRLRALPHFRRHTGIVLFLSGQIVAHIEDALKRSAGTGFLQVPEGA